MFITCIFFFLSVFYRSECVLSHPGLLLNGGIVNSCQAGRENWGKDSPVTRETRPGQLETSSQQ